MAFTFDHASLAEVAVEKGFITPDRVRECLRLEAEAAEAGSAENFVDILLKKEYLKEGQLTACKRALAGKDKLAGFELLEMVGQGAMGAVFRARQTGLDRIVAVKVLPRKYAQDKKYLEQFLAEARAVAALNHENVIQGIDVGVDGEHAYFAMEFVDGPTVRQMIRDRGRLPEQEALGIALQIARALEHAQKNGLVHRDVKPDNIMLTSAGTAKLCDLGLARRKEDVASGAAVGTPFYISPEQARGASKLDIRTDIYSLGATLFHMLTGRPPYVGETARAVMDAHLNDPVPDVRRSEASVSLRTAALIKSMMAKDPAKRPRDATALILEIELALGKKEPEAAGAAAAAGRARTTRVGVRAARRGSGGLVFALAALGAGAVAVAIILGSTGKPSGPKEDPAEKARREAEKVAERALAGALAAIESHPAEHAANIKALEEIMPLVAGTFSGTAARGKLAAEKEAMERSEEEAFSASVAAAKELASGGRFRDAAEALLSMGSPLRKGKFADRWKAEADSIERSAEKAVEQAGSAKGFAEAKTALEALKSQATEASSKLIDSKLAEVQSAEAERARSEEERRRAAAAAETKRRKDAHDRLITAVYALTSSGRMPEAKELLASAPKDRDYRGLDAEIAAEERDIGSIEALYSAVASALSREEGQVKLTWKGRPVAGSVKETRDGRVVIRTREGAEFAVHPSEISALDVARFAGNPSGEQERLSRAAAYCGMGLLPEALDTLGKAEGAEADRLRAKIAVLSRGREPAARAAIDAAARLADEGRRDEAIAALAALEKDFAGTAALAEASERLADIRAKASTGAVATRPAAAPDVPDTEAGRRAAAGDWRGLTAAAVKTLGDGRVQLSYSFADAIQVADWKAVSGGWTWSAGALESVTDEDTVAVCRLPFARIESVELDAVAHTDRPACLGWTACNDSERYPGGAVWGWMRNAGNNFNGGMAIESAGAVAASKVEPAPHRRLCRMQAFFENALVRWKVGGVDILSAELKTLPKGRLVGVGTAGAPGRFQNVVVTGTPDYKPLTAMLDEALARAKVELDGGRAPWRQIFDTKSLAGWQIRSGLWDEDRGAIEKQGPQTGRVTRRGFGGPAIIASDVKASDFIFEATAYVLTGGPEADNWAGLVFGDAGGDFHVAGIDFGGDRYFIDARGRAQPPEYIPAAEKLEKGEEHALRLVVIGSYVRLESDCKVKLTAKVVRAGDAIGLYAESPSAVRFKDIRVKVMKE